MALADRAAAKYRSAVAAATEGVARHTPAPEREAREIGAELQSPSGGAAQTSSIIAGIVISAALLIGVFVVAQIDTALPSLENAGLQSDKNDVVDRVGDAFLMGAVVVIVLFAAVILRVLRSL